MPTHTSHTERLRALLTDRSTVEVLSPLPSSLDPLGHLIHAFLTWEASCSHATDALNRLMAFACDYNDLRVCQEDEMMAVLADTDPCAQERCRRLRACLNSLYQRENGLTFRSLVEFDRRQTRRYLNTLDGMVPFVMARIQLMVANQRAMPLDERLLSRLQREGYLPPELALRKAQRLIEKVCESCEETRQAYFAVETLGAGLQQHPPE